MDSLKAHLSPEENMYTQFRALTMALVLSMSWVAAAAASPQKNEPKSQQDIVKEVRHQLVMLPYYSVFDILSYKVEGDKVTLEGAVVRPSLKSDAEAAVKSVSGVSSIVNNINVLPTSPLDDQIRRAEFRAIYSDPALSRYGYQAVQAIHIIVKNGHVALEGAVDSANDKNLAGIRANGVPNVFGVDNNLQVAGEGGK
jgi:hyperosmotically inducible periplasmic protein